MPDTSHLKGLNYWDDPLVDSYDMLAYTLKLKDGKPIQSGSLVRTEHQIQMFMLSGKQVIYWKAHYEKKGYQVRYAQSTFGEGAYE